MHPYQGFGSKGETKEVEDKQAKEVHQEWSQHLGGNENEKCSEEEEKVECRGITRFWEHENICFRWRIQ